MPEETRPTESPPYPDEVTAAAPTREGANDRLVEWIRLGFVIAPPKGPSGARTLSEFLATVPFIPPRQRGDLIQRRRLAPDAPRQVLEHDPERDELAVSTDLATWVWGASHDPEVAAVYGRSERLWDAAYFALEREAFDFLNHLLRLSDTFDEPAVRAAAAEFWHALASGQETVEIGGHVLFFETPFGPDAIETGPGLEMHRVAGAWAESRFERAAEIPENRWAAVAHITRPRKWASYRSPSRDEPGENAALERALLPLRLVRPSPLLLVTDVDYRVGHAGCYSSPDHAAFVERTWSNSERFNVDVVLTAAGVEELAVLGRHLSILASADAYVRPADTDSSFELALRSFTSAFNRRRWQDRVVDLAVVLEALFGEQGSELTHKVAMRTALLTGRAPEESTRLFRVVKAFYGLRSKIVHGAAKQVAGEAKKTYKKRYGADPADTNLGSQVVAIAMELVGEALRAVVHLVAERGKPSLVGSQAFVDEIDELAFNPTGRAAWQRTARLI